MTRPASWASLAAASSPRPVGGGGAAPAQPGVGLQMDPGRAPGDRRGRGQPRAPVGRSGRQVHLGGDGLGVVVLGDGHQAQDRLFDAGRAQLERLGHVHDAQPVGAAAHRRPGGRNRAVAVPVGLDHRHHRGGGHVRPQRRDVPGDRAELDASLRMAVHSHNAMARARRNAAGSAATTSDAPIGASPPPVAFPGAAPPARPAPAAASRAARPCRYAADSAACGAASPWASSAPASPARTSPVPAVASHDVPVGVDQDGVEVVRRRDDRGRPLEQHARAELGRRAARVLKPPGRHVGRVRPSSRPSSPACGVSSVGAARGSRSRWLASSVSPSASMSTGRLVASTPASRSAAAASVPIPGPATHACTRPTSSGNWIPRQGKSLNDRVPPAAR